MKWEVVITFAPFCDLMPHLASGCETMLLFLSPLRAMAHSYSAQRHHFSHLLNWFHNISQFFCRVVSALKVTAVLSDAWNESAEFMMPLTITIITSASSSKGFCRHNTTLFFFKPSLWPRLLCWTVSQMHVVTSPTVHLAHLFHYNTAI